MDGNVICLAPKIECSATSSSSSTKPKRATLSNKASSKLKPVQEKESARRDYSKDNELKNEKNQINVILNVLTLLTIRRKN